MFEHMAFKGTDTIGTTDPVAEKKALARCRARLRPLRRRAQQARQSRSRETEGARSRPRCRHRKGQFLRGAESLSAHHRRKRRRGHERRTPAKTPPTTSTTSPPTASSSGSIWNPPASCIPVPREFYKERSVVREERRMRTESDPQGKLFEQMLAAAIEAHPYRVPPVGWASDIENLRVEDAQEVLRQILRARQHHDRDRGRCGSANASRLWPTEYFGRLPKRPLPPPVTTVEPAQEGPRRVEVESPAQPIELIAYHRPDQYDKDDPVFDVIAEHSLRRAHQHHVSRSGARQASRARGRRRRHRAGRQIPQSVPLLSGSRAWATPLAENEKELDTMLADFQKNKVDEAALARVKTKTRARPDPPTRQQRRPGATSGHLLRNYGDWRKLFTSIDEIDKVTADDVQRVAKQYFIPQNRTIAVTYQPAWNPPRPPGRCKMKALLPVSAWRFALLAPAQQAVPPASWKALKFPPLPRDQDSES